MIKDIVDNLEYEDGELSIECPFPTLGDDVHIVFDANDQGACSGSQLKQFTWLYENIASIYPEIEKVLFEYYIKSSPSYREGLGELADELMPELSSSAQVWNQITEPGIWVMSDDDGTDIHLEYECTFDVEKGVRVVLNNERIKRVGH